MSNDHSADPGATATGGIAMTATGPDADSTTPCPGDCGQPIALERFACDADWYRLPFDLRQALHAAPNRSRYAAAAAAAREWYRDNPGVRGD